MQLIHSNQAPKAIGPYSHAVKTGSMLFCSGQTPLNPASMRIEATDIEGQTRRALENLQLILQQSGVDLQNVVKVNVYLADMALFQGMNAVYELYFEGHRPARTTVAVNGLPHDALVEIECIAEIKSTDN